MQKWILSCKAFFLCLAILVSPGCGKKPELPEIPGVKGPLFNMVDGKVMVTMKLLQIDAPGGVKFPIPKTKASFAEISPNVEDGGTLIVFYLDVDDLRSVNIGVGDPNTLPDGRPVPGIPGGTLNNSLRIDTPFMDMSFYLHQKLFGMYIPFHFDTYGISGYYNIVINGKNIGMLSLVSNDGSGRPAAGLIFLRLETLKDPSFQALLKLSKKNPHKVY